MSEQPVMDPRQRYSGWFAEKMTVEQLESLILYQTLISRAMENLAQHIERTGHLPHTITLSAFFDARQVVQTISILPTEGEDE